MNSLCNIGSLMYLYLDEIEIPKSIDIHEFQIAATANLLKQNDRRNWLPAIVKEIGKDKYELIANYFVIAVAEKAGLESVWCIIADDREDTAEISQILMGEKTPKINLCTASRDEIRLAIAYLIDRSFFKGVNLAIAVNRIDEAPNRKQWKTLDSITKLKCGITKGAKLNALKEVFYLKPETVIEPENIIEPESKNLGKMIVKDLQNMAKELEISGYSKMKKVDLITAIDKILNKSK